MGPHRRVWETDRSPHALVRGHALPSHSDRRPTVCGCPARSSDGARKRKVAARAKPTLPFSCSAATDRPCDPLTQSCRVRPPRPTRYIHPLHPPTAQPRSPTTRSGRVRAGRGGGAGRVDRGKEEGAAPPSPFSNAVTSAAPPLAPARPARGGAQSTFQSTKSVLGVAGHTLGGWVSASRALRGARRAPPKLKMRNSLIFYLFRTFLAAARGTTAPARPARAPSRGAETTEVEMERARVADMVIVLGFGWVGGRARRRVGEGAPWFWSVWMQTPGRV